MASSPKEAPAPLKLYQWFTVQKVADNDYCVVSAMFPLPPNAIRGQKMVMPEEVYDRWAIDAEEMLSKVKGEW